MPAARPDYYGDIFLTKACFDNILRSANQKQTKNYLQIIFLGRPYIP